MRRFWWLFILFALMVCAVPARANQRAFGYCENGGVIPTVSNLPLNAAVQGSYPTCTITVYLTGTLTLAAIYSDNVGTPLANPFTGSVSGYWFFYATNGRYDVRLSGSGIPTPFTLGDILLNDSSGGGGGGGGTPCTTTALAVQFNNSGAFGCFPDVTFGTPHTMLFGSSGILNLSAASALNGIALPAAAGASPTVDGSLAVNTATHATVIGSNGNTIGLAAAALGVNTATTCTNQVVTAISAIAPPTCTTLTGAFLPNPAGDVTGTYSATTVTGLHFGATGLSLGTAPTTGQCVGLSGGVLTGLSCSPGTTNNATQYSAAYYSAAGSAATISGVSPPTTGNQSYVFCSTPSGGVAAAPAWCLPGVPFDAQTGTTYTIAGDSDRQHLITISNTSAIAITLPQAGTGLFTNNFSFALCNINTGLATITPTTSTWNGNATQIVPNHWCSYGYSDNSNYRGGTFADIAAFPNSPTNALGFTAATGLFNSITALTETSVTSSVYDTTTNCAAAGSAANPSLVACSAAASGSFSVSTSASTGTAVISTTAVTANSRIFVQPSSAEGTNLSVTCNTTADTGLTSPRLASKSAGTSFTINLGTFSTNPLCFNYWVVN